MKVDVPGLRSLLSDTAGARTRGHRPDERVRPSRFRYDYITLRTLALDIRDLLGRLPEARAARALDLGSSNSPYREWLEGLGFGVETLDSDPASGADHIGSAEATGLDPKTFDLILCTQVLEHVPDPLAVLREIARLLKPDGSLIASVPHVWFYHPHPGDYWRFTPEGILELCRRTGLVLVELRAQGGSITAFLQAFNFLTYGILGRAGAPLYAAVNVFADIIRGADTNVLFAHNFAWLATRQADSGLRAD